MTFCSKYKTTVFEIQIRDIRQRTFHKRASAVGSVELTAHGQN